MFTSILLKEESQQHVLMLRLGCRDLCAALQDVVQFGPMGRTLFGQVLADPGFVPQIFKHVGIPPMLDWVRHFSALGTYTLLDKVGEQQPCTQMMPAVQQAPCACKRALSGVRLPHGRPWSSPQRCGGAVPEWVEAPSVQASCTSYICGRITSLKGMHLQGSGLQSMQSVTFFW